MPRERMTAQSEFTISVDDKNIAIYSLLSESSHSYAATNGLNFRIASISDRSILNTKDDSFVPLKAGTVTVTYLCNTFGPEGVLYVTTTVTISASATVFPDSISATISNSSMTVGDTAQLSVTFTPSNTNVKTLNYTSLNSSVVRVSSTGLVTAVGAGSTQIQITDARSHMIKVDVTVAAKPVQPTDPNPTSPQPQIFEPLPDISSDMSKIDEHADSPWMNEANAIWIDQRLESIVQPGMSDKQKAEAIAEFLCDYMSAYGSLRINTDFTVDHGLCGDYSIRYQAFCMRAGLDCEFIIGRTRYDNSGYTASHGWNRVKCDGKWYYVDVTWMDVNTPPYARHYLLSEDYWMTHSIDGVWGRKSASDWNGYATVVVVDENTSDITVNIGDVIVFDSKSLEATGGYHGHSPGFSSHSMGGLFGPDWSVATQTGTFPVKVYMNGVHVHTFNVIVN